MALHRVQKIDPSDYSVVATFGWLGGGTSEDCIYNPAHLFYYSGKVYVCGNSRLVILDSDLAFVAEILPSGDYYSPWDVAVDDDYIYISEPWQYIHRYDATTYAFVDSTDVGADSSLCGMTIDASYLYFTDEDDETVKRYNKATMALVDALSYEGDIHYAASENVTAGTVISGSYEDTLAADGTKYITAPVNPGGLDVDLTINVGSGKTLKYLHIESNYKGTAPAHCHIYIYNHTTSAWTVNSYYMAAGDGSTDSNFKLALSANRQDAAGNVKVRFASTDTDTAARLSIDQIYATTALAYSFPQPISLYCDDTYLYVCDQTDNKIYRITKAPMAYCDPLDASANTYLLEQVAIVGSNIYAADRASALAMGKVLKYTFPGMALVDASPDYWDEDPFLLDSIRGITCDDDYIYIGHNSVETGNEIRIYDKSSKAYVAAFPVGTGTENMGTIAVDETHVYVPLYVWDPDGGTTKKYLKTSPYTEVGTVDDIFSYSVDTTFSFTIPPVIPATCSGVAGISIDPATMILTGTGTGANSTEWQVVRVYDGTVMDSGSGASASYSFVAEYNVEYQLQFRGA
jgi:hypothetical protein